MSEPTPAALQALIAAAHAAGLAPKGDRAARRKVLAAKKALTEAIAREVRDAEWRGRLAYQDELLDCLGVGPPEPPGLDSKSPGRAWILCRSTILRAVRMGSPRPNPYRIWG